MQNAFRQFTFFLLGLSAAISSISRAQPRTYCNPLNLDYAYGAIPNFAEQGNHRTTADPVITLFNGNYFLFSTNQYGYWWSSDLYDWKFIPRKFLKPYHKVYDELCAPAAVAVGDTLMLIGSTHTKNFPFSYQPHNPFSYKPGGFGRGAGHGAAPDTVKHFVALHGDSERRNAWLKWRQSDEAIGYTIYTGIAPDKLYNNILVYSANEHYFTGMEKDRAYYFQIEAFNENSIGRRTAVIKPN